MVSPGLGPTMEGYVEGLKFAADVVHQEARWQIERDMNRIPGAGLIAERMVVIEVLLENKIKSIEEEGKHDAT